MHLRLVVEKSVHGPSGIETHKISQQRAAGTKTIAANEGANTGCFDLNAYGIAGFGISNGRPAYGVVFSVPCTAQVNKLHQLEITQEGIVDGFIEQGGKYG